MSKKWYENVVGTCTTDFKTSWILKYHGMFVTEKMIFSFYKNALDIEGTEHHNGPKSLYFILILINTSIYM